jgi:hypothetical protein
MTHWYCKECKTTRPEHQMLSGWNGVWCPNCMWNEVSPIRDSGAGLHPSGSIEQTPAGTSGTATPP